MDKKIISRIEKRNTKVNNLLGVMDSILTEWKEKGTACTRIEFESLYYDIIDLLV